MRSVISSVAMGVSLLGCQGLAEKDPAPTIADLEAQGLVTVDYKTGKAGPTEQGDQGSRTIIPIEVRYYGPPSEDGVTIDRQWTCPAEDGVIHLEWKCRKFDPSKDEFDG